MNDELSIEYKIPKIDESELSEQEQKAKKSYKKLLESNLDMTGWIDYPNDISEEFISQILKIADEIKNKYTALVIVGIGGSYLGAQAAFDYIKRDYEGPKIFFAGINLSTEYHNNILNQLKNESPALLIISKSGGTTETLVAGNIFMEYLENRFGEKEKDKRIYIITDPKKGRLRNMVNEKKYPSLPIPGNIGGRYSVLTAVGLLPMAVSGINIKEIIEGAKSARRECIINKAVKLASVRNLIEQREYFIELFASFDPYMEKFINWIKQLYGESEGKNNKGIFPVYVDYTKDLHSLGQFIQEGRPMFSETFISVKENDEKNIPIHKSWGISDDDLTMTQLNSITREGVISAHCSADVPITMIELQSRTEHTFGQAVYFFQISCAIRGLMMDIDPFNQPGVEKYKEETRKKLKNQ